MNTKEQEGIPYSVREARGAATEHKGMDIYHKELMLFLCDKAEELKEDKEEAYEVIGQLNEASDKLMEDLKPVMKFLRSLPEHNLSLATVQKLFIKYKSALEEIAESDNTNHMYYKLLAQTALSTHKVEK